MANAWYYNASYYINDWSKAGQLVNQSEYQAALSAINKAVDLDPNHPHYLHIKGRIIVWGIGANFEPKLTFHDVRALYQRALHVRQAWPDTWADLAKVNFYLEGLTPVTLFNIEQALKYGPYQQLVTTSVLDILMQSWPILTPVQKALFFKQLSIGLQQQKLISTIFNSAKSNKLNRLICTQIKFDQQFKSIKNTWVTNRYCQ
jgi:hypothetical protein